MDEDAKVKIYVACHNKFVPPEELKTNDIFVPILSGKAIYDPEHDTGKKGSKAWIPEFGDDTGDNISFLNPYFCELTVLYWAWKNDKDSDYIGLNHYRRFFSSDNDDTLFITKEEILNNLKNYDYLVHGCSSDYQHWYNHKFSIYEGYKGSHDIRTFDIALEVCKELYPDMYDSFYYETMENSAMCLCNLILCKRELLDEYCSWLFPLLFKVHERLDYKNVLTDSYSQRAVGFLAERLMRIWFTVTGHTYKDQPVLSD